ncbi:MAG TPA: hypothetical protein VFI65_30775 [Streptosporangiaceae bacterium]|nr:hypothetical protein [Streptosporangiaceae bacterium]
MRPDGAAVPVAAVPVAAVPVGLVPVGLVPVGLVPVAVRPDGTVVRRARPLPGEFGYGF